MGNYGAAAVLAVRMCQTDNLQDPCEAWIQAVNQVFPDSPSSRNKGCPRGAFLGLCEDGCVAGVQGGSFTRSKLNKQYALRAVHLLGEDPSLADDPAGLWKRVQGGVMKTPNGQMEVVTRLWTEGLIRRPGSAAM